MYRSGPYAILMALQKASEVMKHLKDFFVEVIFVDSDAYLVI